MRPTRREILVGMRFDIVVWVFVHPELPRPKSIVTPIILVLADVGISAIPPQWSLLLSSSSSFSLLRRLRGLLSGLLRRHLRELLGGIFSISRISSTLLSSSKRASTFENYGVSKPSRISSFNASFAILIKDCSSR